MLSPLDRQPRVHPAAALGQFIETTRPARLGGDRAPVIEPLGGTLGGNLDALVVRHIGLRSGRRHAVDVHEAAIRPWFDLAHEWIVRGFADLTSAKVQQQV